MADSPTPSAGVAKDIALFLVAVVVMVACMVAYWSYPFPSGDRPDIWGFIALFFREALLLAFFAAVALFVLAVALVGALIRLVSKLRAAVRRAA